jgi:16S rRNA G966 N2-methylase RsmD
MILGEYPTHPLIWDPINPGDSFYWVYWDGPFARNNVEKDEQLFSSVTNAWVGPISGVCMLIEKTSTHVRFLNSEGRIIHTFVSDTWVHMRNESAPSAVPVPLEP